MQKLIAATLTASILAMPVVTPASALPIDIAPKTALTTSEGEGTVQEVAFRHFGGFHGGGFHHGSFGGFHRGGFGGLHRGFGGFHRGFGGRRFGGFAGRRFGGFGGRRFYGGRRFGYGGYGVGAGIAGLAAGAIIGGTIAAAARTHNSVAYCESRFKSYNPATGTYLGYDGLRHRCP